MFRNRWLALLFVGLTLASVTKLIGTEKRGGTLRDATASTAKQRQPLPGPTSPPSGSATAGEVVYAIPSDADLIDDTAGIEPVPSIVFASEDQPGEDHSPAGEAVPDGTLGDGGAAPADPVQ